jgi:hypothetical protein
MLPSHALANRAGCAPGKYHAKRGVRTGRGEGPCAVRAGAKRAFLLSQIFIPKISPGNAGYSWIRRTPRKAV